MSIIQDALRRKLDEQRTQVSTGERPKPTPAPQQAPPVAQQVIQNENRDVVRRPRQTHHWDQPPEKYARGHQPRDEGKTVQFLLGLILVMLVAAFIGAVMYFLDARNQPIPPQAVQAPQPAVVQVPQPLAPAAPVAQPAPNVPAPVEEVAPVPVPEPQPVPVAQPAPVAVATTTANGWPVINVGGVLAGSSAKGSSAILNGEWVRVRQKIDGVRLTDVGNEGVTLEFNGETRFVETGNSTDDEE